MRPALCEEALRLGRILATLAPQEPEVHGLVALMELQASRTPARTGPDGTPILLQDQDRRLWDRLLIRRGLEALTCAEGTFGPYVLQASIAACHARATHTEETDWEPIAALYDVLAYVIAGGGPQPGGRGQQRPRCRTRAGDRRCPGLAELSAGPGGPRRSAGQNVHPHMQTSECGAR